MALPSSGRVRYANLACSLTVFVSVTFCLCDFLSLVTSVFSGAPTDLPGRSGAVINGRLSRKEVFQPHLPVRLPCYDLAPVTGLALGRSFSGHALQAPPAPMA